MPTRLILIAVALITFSVEATAAPGSSRGANAPAGRPSLSQDHQSRDGMHRRDATNRTRKDAQERGSSHRVDPNAKGDETATTMRSRRDDRKAIQDDYRADRQPGQEGTHGEGAPQKRSWWKFWSR